MQRLPVRLPRRRGTQPFIGRMLATLRRRTRSLKLAPESVYRAPGAGQPRPPRTRALTSPIERPKLKWVKTAYVRNDLVGSYLSLGRLRRAVRRPVFVQL